MQKELTGNYDQNSCEMIPYQWEMKDIGSILSIKHGRDQKQVQCVDGIYPILGTGGEIGRTNTFLYDKASVLIGRKGTINKPSFMNTPFWTVDTLFYTEIENKYCSKFIYYKFCLINWLAYNEASGVPSLNASTIESVRLSLPKNKNEQKAIANALSDVDALITSLEKLIAKKRAIKTAAMQQLLTGKKRLPPFDKIHTGYKQTELGEIPEDWEVDSIDEVLSITTGDKNTQDKVKNGEYPFFVRSKMIERINSYSFDGEAVLTAGDGVGTGKVHHYINGKFDYHQRVYLMHSFCDRLDGYYFYIYFSNNFYDRIMSMTAKSSVDSVRREMISDMKIVLPKIDEQIAISKALNHMENEIEKLEQRLNKTKQLKKGMMQELVTGRTRLV